MSERQVSQRLATERSWLVCERTSALATRAEEDDEGSRIVVWLRLERAEANKDAKVAIEELGQRQRVGLDSSRTSYTCVREENITVKSRVGVR